MLPLIVLALAMEAPNPPADWRPITEQAKGVIRSAVGRRLLDEQSAQWRWPRENYNGVLYCGWVNAKNSYGGYTGFKPYLVIGAHANGPNGGGRYMASAVELASDRDRIVYEMCTEGGFDMTGPPVSNPDDRTGN